MRPIFLLLLLALPLSAEQVFFDLNDRFSVEFPDEWKKAKAPDPNVVVHRESADGEATFSISRLILPPDKRADLDTTLDTFIKNFKMSGLTVKGDPKGQDSLIDGKKALVASIPIELKQEGELVRLTFFMVLIECKERLVVMQATLRGNGTNDQRRDCRVILGSFEEHTTSKEDKKDQSKDPE